MKPVKERAKELAERFNKLSMPPLPYLKASNYLSENRIAHYAFMMSLEMRDKFFSIEINRQKGVRPETIYRKKETPVYYERFVELIEHIKSKTVKNSAVLPDSYAGFTVEKCIAFLKQRGYTGKLEKTVKTEIEI